MIRFKRILALKSMFKTSGRAPVALVLNIAQQNLRQPIKFLALLAIGQIGSCKHHHLLRHHCQHARTAGSDISKKLFHHSA